MKLVLSKIVCLGILAVPLVAYAAIVGGHILVHKWFNDSVLHTKQESIIEIPGMSWLPDQHQQIYCVDKAVAGKAIGPGRWYENLCESEPATRLSVYSKYQRRFWVSYLDANETLRFKRTWNVH